MKELPREHIPDILRSPEQPKRTEQAYACGSEYTLFSFGMWYGPTTSLENCLEQVPSCLRPVAWIFRFNVDGTDDKLYRWNIDRWVFIEERL